MGSRRKWSLETSSQKKESIKTRSGLSLQEEVMTGVDCSDSSASLSGADGFVDFAGEVAVGVTSPSVAGVVSTAVAGVASPAVAGAALLGPQPVRSGPDHHLCRIETNWNEIDQ